MKVAVTIGVYDPVRGGAERSTSQIVEQLAARGHEVTVVTGFCPEDVRAEGARILSLRSKKPEFPWWVWQYSRWARRELSRGGYDVSLSVSTMAPASVVQPRGGTVRETLRRNIAMRRSPSSRATKRFFLNLSIKQRILLALERRTLRDPMVKHVVAVSRYVADQLREYRFDPARVTVIPNAAEVPAVTAEVRQRWREKVRHGFGIAPDTPVYLFAAHNPRLKGFGPLVEAAGLLVHRGINPVVLVAGPIKFSQQSAVARAGLRDHVRFVSTTDQMAQLYAAADVTVLPTFYDPSSKVVIESLMMGTPAITTSFNGASDFIRGGPGGVLRGRVINDPSDVESLAQAMAELADPGQRQRCVSAMDGLAQSLSIARHVDQLETLLQQVAQQQNRSGQCRA